MDQAPAIVPAPMSIFMSLSTSSSLPTFSNSFLEEVTNTFDSSGPNGKAAEKYPQSPQTSHAHSGPIVQSNPESFETDPASLPRYHVIQITGIWLDLSKLV